MLPYWIFHIADGNDIPEVYGPGEAGLFDKFFSFLDHFGFKDLFLGLDPKSKKRKSPVHFHAVIYIYLMRIVTGLKFYRHIDPVILHSQSLMRLVGFNGREVREDTCRRGRKKDKEPGKRIRGTVCPGFMSLLI